MPTKSTSLPLHYTHHDVADLVWVIGSCPMFTSEASKGQYHIPDEEWFSNQLEVNVNWIRQLDADPQPLLEFLREHPHKLLGKRFETLVEFWLKNSPDYDFRFANVQLKTGPATSGEIDFLCREKATGEFVHFEVACKYYLATTSALVWDKWMGANGNDSLHHKMKKFEKQFLVLEREEGKKFLERNSLDKPARVLIMKGYFFHHCSMIGKHRSPKYAHPHHQGGWFMFHFELDSLRDSVPQWIVPPKEFWMSPYCSPSGTLEVFTGSELVQQVDDVMIKKGKAPLIIQVENRDGWDVETSRGFIVKDDWPFSE
ncbi:MAG: DUF1853 family protein [Flavobacteriales bacterium]|nr:DUF1853 family protein [Flavobacteriales bacterium]